MGRKEKNKREPNNRKKQMGITLISLVITIIILILLASISIEILIGDSGIIRKAKEAKEEIGLAQNKEEKAIEKLTNRINDEKFEEAKTYIEINGENIQYTTPSIYAKIILQANTEVSIADCKWTVNHSKNAINEEEYKNNFKDNPETVKITLEEGTTYIHVLTVTEEGDKVETISNPIRVIQNKHKHTEACKKEVTINATCSISLGSIPDDRWEDHGCGSKGQTRHWKRYHNHAACGAGSILVDHFICTKCGNNWIENDPFRGADSHTYTKKEIQITCGKQEGQIESYKILY